MRRPCGRLLLDCGMNSMDLLSAWLGNQLKASATASSLSSARSIVPKVSRTRTGGARVALNTIVGVAVGMLACRAALGQSGAAKGHPNTTGWRDLFAPDLSNAVMEPGGWAWEKGELVAKNHGTIWTKESYANFILDLEFKVAKHANSGVFLRSGDTKKVLSALEIQVHESTDGGQYGMVGALYNCKAPSKRMEKPAGEWNRFTITCRLLHPL